MSIMKSRAHADLHAFAECNATGVTAGVERHLPPVNEPPWFPALGP